MLALPFSTLLGRCFQFDSPSILKSNRPSLEKPMSLLITFTADNPPLSVIAAAKFAGAEYTLDSSLPSGSSPSLTFPDGSRLSGLNVLRYFGRISNELFGRNGYEASQEEIESGKKVQENEIQLVDGVPTEKKRLEVLSKRHEQNMT